MKYVLLIAVFLWEFTTAYSQQYATCDDAKPISTSTYGPITPEAWADSSLCVPDNPNMYFGKSHMVVWLSFIVPYDTMLTFQIVPQHPTDDFDFILFKADRGDFCQKEKQRKVQPVRTNFAKPPIHSNGITGLSENASNLFVPPGNNFPYSAALPVKKGEWYYLVVDNYISNKGGFTLKLPLRFSANTNVVSTIDAAPVKAPLAEIPASSNFYIHVLDSANHPIKANLIIEGAQKNKSVKVDTADYSLRLEKFQSLTIHANAKGFMPYQSAYSGSGDTSAVTFWIHLVPIKSSQKITLKDIQFKEDSPIILPVSESALDYILQFLLKNPNVNVIIKGYTNDPNQTQSERYDQNLSEQRANSVKNYLSSHGVDKNRMKCIGYGSSQMLYPRPTTKEQQAANRRVEIEIQ